MQRYLKFAIAIPVFAAMMLSASILFPGAPQQVQAQSQNASEQSNMSMSMNSGMVSGVSKAEEGTIVVHIKSGNANSTDDLHSAKMGIEIAQHMRAQGRDVIIVLDVQGANLAVAHPKTGLEEHAKMIQDFLNTGGRVVVCEPCLNEAGYKISDLAPGVEYNRPAKMSAILSGSAIVIDY
jgi:predicted peroxiredoxin